MKLSAIVITKNEAAVIARCLASLDFADEVIVIDAESTDATKTVAQQHGATVWTNPWPGYGQQRNFGLAKSPNEWALMIDADEVVSPPLRQSVLEAIMSPRSDFHWLRVITVFLGRPLNHLYGHNLRLFRRSAGHYSNSHVHEQVLDTSGVNVRLGDNRSVLLDGALMHYSHETIGSYLAKMHRYTSLDAQEMAKSMRHRSGKAVTARPLLPAYLALRQFLKLLIYRRGILDGLPGFMWCVLSSYYEWEMASKFLALARNVSEKRKAKSEK